VVHTGEARSTLAVDPARDETQLLADEEVGPVPRGISDGFGWLERDMDADAFKACIAKRRRPANRPHVR
jgi:hypothetical protein